MNSATSDEETVIAYHERSKHHFHRYATGPGRLDWAAQPDPFRRYDGAELIPLALPAPDRILRYEQLYTPAGVATEVLSADSVSLLFRYALSLTAWKSFQGTRWALRANPSSGNLHPTEGYALLPPLAGVGDAPALYHYAPREHGLERRARFHSDRWHELISVWPAGSFFVALSSIHWREAWKYGERAFRYCQQDVGHALAALCFAAAAQGWRAQLLDGIGADRLNTVMGLDRSADYTDAEREEAELLLVIAPAPSTLAPFDGAAFATLTKSAQWYGQANRLSPPPHAQWPVIEQIAVASRNQTGLSIREDVAPVADVSGWLAEPQIVGARSAEQIILGRRSAVAMDGVSSISRPVFLQMLARLLPTREQGAPPWQAIPWRPRIHLAMFVHRVDGIGPGLYALVRDHGRLAELQQQMAAHFLWQNVAGALPLYLLQAGDCRALAAEVSCGQDIAGDGAFSFGMLADYMASLHRYGAALYRRLYWEAGMLGQVLYLEAEAAGVRATGMGCYFDDPVHQVFGLKTRDWQSFYHFTVGSPVDDTRLTSLPAYAFTDVNGNRISSPAKHALT